jgi:hypothetical protein
MSIIATIEQSLRDAGPWSELVVTLSPPGAELHVDGEFISDGLAPAQSWPLTDEQAADLIARGLADHIRG